MKSPEKVRLAIDNVEQLLDRGDLPAELGFVASFVALGRPQIERVIPTDPDRLDELLGNLSAWAGSLMSDPEEDDAAGNGAPRVHP